jgi:putative effector of murein hydrolase
MFFFSIILYPVPINIKIYLLYILTFFIWICTSYFLYKLEIRAYRKTARIIAFSFIISNIVIGSILLFFSIKY